MLRALGILVEYTDHAGIWRPSAALAFAALLATDRTPVSQRVMRVGRDTVNVQHGWTP